MTVPDSFHPSNEDIHKIISHDPGIKGSNAKPAFKPGYKSNVPWKKSSANNIAAPKRTIIDDEKDAISPHFDS